MTSSAVLSVQTPEGEGRFHVALPADPTSTTAVLVLGHGAGGGVDAVDLSVLARRLPDHGVVVLRFEQPWRVAGRKIAVRPPKLDVAWEAALTGLTELAPDLAELPLFVGGRSAGARVACRTSAAGPLAERIAGIVCCAFPLHLPGRTEASRAAELLAPSQPVLVLQGQRDTFGGFAEVDSVVRASNREQIRLVEVPGADHSMRVPARGEVTPAQVRDLIVAQTLDFLASGSAPTAWE